MSDYERERRAILELSELIQRGDLLTMKNGGRYASAGAPGNPCAHMLKQRAGLKNPLRYSMWLYAWLVSVLIDTCWIPVALNAVCLVERTGQTIWNEANERMPVQRMLL